MFINYMTPNNFVGNISRLPNTTFHLQRTNIPSISASAISRPTELNPLRETYDSLSYHELNWSFLVDENMDNYMEIFNWMHHIAFPQDFSQYKNNDKKYNLKSDISVIILNSSKNAQKIITFYDAFPVFLGDANFDSTLSETKPLTVDVTFNYNYYSIEDSK